MFTDHISINDKSSLTRSQIENTWFEAWETLIFKTVAGISSVSLLWIWICVRSQSISWRNEPERLQTMMHNLLLKPSKNLVKTICLVKKFEPEINFPAHEVNKHLHVLPLTHKWRKSSSILTSNFVTGALGLPPVQIVGSMTQFYYHTLSCHTDVRTCHTPPPDPCPWDPWCHGSSWLASWVWHSCPWRDPIHTCSQQKLLSPWWACHGQLLSNLIHSLHVF